MSVVVRRVQCDDGGSEVGVTLGLSRFRTDPIHHPAPDGLPADVRQTLLTWLGGKLAPSQLATVQRASDGRLVLRMPDGTEATLRVGDSLTLASAPTS